MIQVIIKDYYYLIKPVTITRLQYKAFGIRKRKDETSQIKRTSIYDNETNDNRMKPTKENLAIEEKLLNGQRVVHILD